MITKSFKTDEWIHSEATFSDCMNYRYQLLRVWDESLPKIMWLMLNPSTADETKNDPTLQRCENRSRDYGFGGFYVCNIFAYRATDPRDMKAQGNPIGFDNLTYILSTAAQSQKIVCGWGSHGTHKQQGFRVMASVRQCHDLYALRLTAKGEPSHPLYLPYDSKPFLWQRTAVAQLAGRLD